MDFFEHQERARRWSSRIVWLFLLVVVVVVAAVNAVVALVYIAWSADSFGELAERGSWWLGIDNRVFVSTTAITLLVIFAGAIYRSLQLAQGGKAVAQLVGARRIRRNTEEADERRLLNVVEEMSIASGMLLPAVYVMDDEQGINAFAAGYQPHEAVIVVTSGLLRTLDRDELQGVVAHEFSHIFNGDMRLNVRMLGMLNGVSIIGSLGRHMLRGVRHEPRAAPWLVAAGGSLLAIGYVGVVAARLLKAAVSRQREYLADASAVQFTRSNSGIGRALLKILDHAGGGVMQSRYAEELSHFFFAEGRALWWSGLLATHPPLLERIRRVAPHLLRQDKRGNWLPRELTAAEQVGATTTAFAASPADTPAGGTPKAAPSSSVVESIEATVARPTPSHSAYAADFFLRLAPSIRTAMKEGAGRAALTCCLAVETEWSDVQRAAVTNVWGPQRAAEVFGLIDPVRALGVTGRLPLLELTVPGLRQLTMAEQHELRLLLQKLVTADDRIDMWEWIVVTLVDHVLAPPIRHDKHRNITRIKNELIVTLSALAYTDTSDESAAQTAFRRGMAEFGWPADAILKRDAVTLDAVRDAVAEFTHLTPALRRHVIRACVAVALADSVLAPREMELLRAISATLDCPIPPQTYANVS